MIVTDERVARFVADRCGAVLSPPFTCMGIERDGKVVGGVVFNVFTAFDVSVTVAGDKGAFTLPFVRAVGWYVFHQIGKVRMTIITHQDSVVDIAMRMGAEIEGCKRNQFGVDRHGFVLGILKTDWKF